jgi:hypothetical protein
MGYSLCGEKPVSIETFPSLSRIPTKSAIEIFTKYPGYSIVWNGLDAWLRNCHLFPSNNFTFRYIPEYNTIAIINKRATKKIIKKNLDLFHKCSNPDQTANDFLKEVCNPLEREYLILFNTKLLGILLGYGRNNSIAFSSKSYFLKLEGFKLYDANNDLSEFMNPGFFVINNGMNEVENNDVKRILRKAKNNVQRSFKKGKYFETFVNLFTK